MKQNNDNRVNVNNISDVVTSLMSARGITLIALVITIIILLILAGVALTLTIGENGIINHAKTSKEEYSEAQARDKLELTLLDLQADKLIKVEYNETTYINERLTSKGFAVNGNIVLVDGWQFEIDRSVPKIATSLGRGEIETNIVVNVSSQTRADYVNATLTIEIAYEDELTEIILNGNNLDVPEKNVDGKYVITINNITANGLYSVVAKDGDKINIGSTIISDITEDLEIRNTHELVAFRDRVNNGATFEGKTVTIVSEVDIDLAEVCYKVDGTTANDISWIPIGTDTKPFKGTFNGNNHTIHNLYINTTSRYQGLFGVVNGATIKNVEISSDSEVKADGNSGVIVGFADGSNNIIEYCINNACLDGGSYCAGIVGNVSKNNDNIIRYCINNGEIKGKGEGTGGIIGLSNYKISVSCCGNTGNITGNYYTGGILGYSVSNSSATISGCYNTGDITSRGKDVHGNAPTGGILGFYYHGSGTIQNCYNTGTIDSTYPHIGGIVGNRDTGGLISNCYNIGNFLGSTTIRGSIGGYCINTKFTKCYWTTSPNCSGSTSGTQTSCSVKTEAELKDLVSTLGDAFVADGKIKNAQGEWVDNKDSENNIIYINNGFPVLKWQVE